MASPSLNPKSPGPVHDFSDVHESIKQQISVLSPPLPASILDNSTNEPKDTDSRLRIQNRINSGTAHQSRTPGSASPSNSPSAGDSPRTASTDSTQITTPSEGAPGYDPESPPLATQVLTNTSTALKNPEPVTLRRIKEEPRVLSTPSRGPRDLDALITTEAGHLFRRFIDPPPTVSEALDIADALILFASLSDLGSGQERTKHAVKRITETYRETCEGQWYQFYETFDEYMHVKSLPISIRGMIWEAMDRNGLGSPQRRIPVPEQEEPTRGYRLTEHALSPNQDSLHHRVGAANRVVGVNCHAKEEPEENGDTNFETSQVQRLNVPVENKSEDNMKRKRKIREGRTPRTGRESREIDRMDEETTMLWAEHC